MATGLDRKTFGPHVLDYFKHVSPKSLKSMGLALINLTGSPETLLLYSICVNSAAFKFINTVLSESSPDGVTEGMRGCAAKYLSSAQLAMARIHLLSEPSLLFLQSLLCSVSSSHHRAGPLLMVTIQGIYRSRYRGFDTLLGVHLRCMQNVRRSWP